ncbi:MAG: response regulator transcription factor [Anaerolineae bacterium]|nr:response regulator transcription factor [Anaerolineae bacterium]
MPKQSVLVVDDDREIVRLIRGYLEQAGYTVMTAYTGETALHYLRAEHPDLMLLDLMLPDRDGWDVTRVVRSDPSLANIPIIMLTARIEDLDKILGLEIGADDYVTKPFNPREVVARVKAILRRIRRGENSTVDVLQVADLRMDIRRHEVTRQGQSIDLTVTEFNILRVLMENVGYAFTRNELIEKGLGYVYGGMERTLDSHIKNLRQKIEDDPKQPRYIQTVYGVGYRLIEEQE